MTVVDRLTEICGEQHVLTGADLAAWQSDWTGNYSSAPLAVVRPANTAEVAAVINLATAIGVPVVPVSGNTGLSGGTSGDGVILLSIARLNHIDEINVRDRSVVVGAGVILANLHEKVAEHDMVFPLTFGARGSAMVGGFLSTNAGGSNVVRYGNARDLCLGIEVVTPTGEVMNLMSRLRKDNSGLNLRNLVIGAEGTLGIITAAVLKLVQRPLAYATALVAMASVPKALTLLNRLQAATGNGVEAFEYMPRQYMADYQQLFPDIPHWFDELHEVYLLVEIASTATRDTQVTDQGSVVLNDTLMTEIMSMAEAGDVADAVMAGSEAQRFGMWSLREAAAEIAHHAPHVVGNDVALPVDRVDEFLTRMAPRLAAVDPGAIPSIVSHLGDGNVHYAVQASTPDKQVWDAIVTAVDEEAIALGGSFSAEHGIGVKKMDSMTRHKDPVAMAAMRSIKAALDPNNIMNPGKVY